MPGRLIFATTSDAANAVTESMRIDSSQNVTVAESKRIIGFHATKVSIPTTETQTISSGYQLLIHGSYTISGTLVDDGDLVIL